MLSPISIAEDINGATGAYDEDDITYCDYCDYVGGGCIELSNGDYMCRACFNGIETIDELLTLLGYDELADLADNLQK